MTPKGPWKSQKTPRRALRRKRQARREGGQAQRRVGTDDQGAVDDTCYDQRRGADQHRGRRRSALVCRV